ncbi:MAG TPA: FCD domain-containing protein [Jatrophihabitantaceae bacterium]
MAKRSQVIVDDYLTKIVSGELSEGQVLPTETALIQRYGVSRTAVREAIQALASKGFVSIRQGSGSTVSPRSSWHVLDPEYLELTGGGTAIVQNLVETRDVLEPAIAGLAAARATPDQIAELRRVGARLAEAVSAGPSQADWTELDLAFHHALAECSGNPVLVSIHGSLSQLGRAHGAEARPAHQPGALQRAMFWHEHIVEAVAAGDTAAAQDAMRMHLRQAHAEPGIDKSD